MNAEVNRPRSVGADEHAVELNKRLESIAWGLFLIMLGGIWLVPDSRVPEGTWLVGAGLIMLGLNAARFANRVKMSSTSIGLGVLAIILGTGDFLGVDLPVFPILLIALGASLLLGVCLDPLLEKKDG